MRAARMKGLVRLFAAAAPPLLAASCGLGDFTPASSLSGVRILATRADKPYAAPGDKVELEMLAVDGRPDKKGRTMTLSWIPLPCINPKSDLYYLCFAQFSTQGTGTGGSPSAGLLRPGVNLTPLLPSGPRYSVTLPKDIIDTHAPVQGAPDPYGLAIVFNVACAGHLELLPADPANQAPQQVPIGCFDDDHVQLGADDFVLGFTRIYAYASRRNENPVLQGLTFDGQAVDLAAGVTMDRCTATRRADCPKHELQVTLPDASQEPVPGEGDINGNPRKEVVWVSWFATGGQIESGQRLLFDARAGRVPNSQDKFLPPNEPGDLRLWAVVRDNRGGAAWIEAPMHVR